MEHLLKKSALFYILTAILMFGMASCKEDLDEIDTGYVHTGSAYCMISGVGLDVDGDDTDDGNVYRCFKFTVANESEYSEMSQLCTGNLGGDPSSLEACSTENLVEPGGIGTGEKICDDRLLSPRGTALGNVLANIRADLYMYTDTTPVGSWTDGTIYTAQCTGNQNGDPDFPYGGTFVDP